LTTYDIDGPGRLLVVQTEEKAGEELRVELSEEGYRVEVSADGADALHRIWAFQPHLVLLDLELPDMSGAVACRCILAATGVPVIMVSGAGSEDDVVVGLEAGASDYVVRPYSRRELIARIQAVLRRMASAPVRHPVSTPDCAGIVSGYVRLDVARHLVTVAGRPVPMSRKEFDLLHLLMSPIGRVRTRVELVNSIWKGRYRANTRTIDTHIRRLRLKIEPDPTKPVHLVTIRGIGFRFDHNTELKDLQDHATSLVS